MYTIGEFSSISNLPKKTLRYYDEIGILKPANINLENGYRQYSKEQIIISEKILTYKSFGLSLTDIKSLMQSDNNENLSNLLKLRVNSIDKEIDILKKQKQSIKSYKTTKTSVNGGSLCFEIDSYTFQKGSIVSLKKPFDTTTYHQLINEFYDYIASNNIQPTSSHYIRRSIKDSDSEEIVEIFAYTSDEQKDHTRINGLKTVKLALDDMKHKSEAFAYLIDYAKSNNLTIVEFIEEYTLCKGKMGVNIFGVVKP